MTRFVTAAAVAALLAATPAGATDTTHTMHKGGTDHAGTATVGDLTVEGAWMRQPPPGAKVGGGYLTVTNPGEADDRLLAASAPFATRTEIHEMKVENGMMMMSPLAEGLAIPAGETVSLAPGGYHIMFMGLNAAPKEGETVPVTLTFEQAGAVTLNIPVAAMGATAAPHAMH